MKTDLQKIPGIGKDMEGHLVALGFSSIASLKGQNPEEIYQMDCIAHGCHVDRCVLYCYRLAVWYADHDGELPPDKQKWWNWKE